METTPEEKEREKYSEFIHAFGNAFAIASMTVENLLRADPENHDLKTLHKVLKKLRMHYMKTFWSE